MATRPPSGEIDWERARRFFRARIEHLLCGRPPEVLEDLVQDACGHLVLAARRQELRNQDAFMTTLAKRTVVNFLRAEGKRKLLWETLDREQQALLPASAGSHGYTELSVDSQELLRFCVLQFFQDGRSRCLKLAQLYFAGLDWKTFARQTGQKPNTVRQQWTRCVALLRREAARDPGLMRLFDLL